MSPLSPKPVIARVIRTWSTPPGLTFAVVEDVEKCVWIVESCPVGTQFWTVAQAMQLPRGSRTRRILEEAVRLGQTLALAKTQKRSAALPRSISRETEVPSLSAPADMNLPRRSSRVKTRALPRAAKANLVGV